MYFQLEAQNFQFVKYYLAFYDIFIFLILGPVF